MILLCWKFSKLALLIFLELQTSRHRLFLRFIVSLNLLLNFSQSSILFSLISCFALSLFYSNSSLLFSLFLKLSCLSFSLLFLCYSIFYIYFTRTDYSYDCTFSLLVFIYCLNFSLCYRSQSIQLPFCAFTACTRSCFLRFSRRESACLSCRRASAQLSEFNRVCQFEFVCFVLSIFINFI